MRTTKEMLHAALSMLPVIDGTPTPTPRELTEQEKQDLADRAEIEAAEKRLREREAERNTAIAAQRRAALEQEAAELEAKATALASELKRGKTTMQKAINVLAREFGPLIQGDDTYLEYDRTAARLRAEGIDVNLPANPLRGGDRPLLTYANNMVQRAFAGLGE